MDRIEALGIDAAALQEVYGWTRSNDWSEAFDSFMLNFRELFEELTDGLPGVDLGKLPSAVVTRLVTACFEQFLTMDFESEPPNALDQFLEEAGAELDSTTVDFLVRFRHSSISLYEVVDRVRGSHIILKDLYRKGPKLRVADKPTALVWKYRDTVAARVISVDGKPTLAGSGLVIRRELRDQVRASLEEFPVEAGGDLPKQATFEKRRSKEGPDLADPYAVLLIVTCWLIGLFPYLESFDRSYLVDPGDEGGPLLEARFALRSPMAEVFGKIEAIPDLVRPPFSELIWYRYLDFDDEEEFLMARIWLTDGFLVVNGFSRASVIGTVQRLSELLGDRVTEPMIEEHVLESEQEEDEEFPIPGRMSDEEDSAFQERMHRYLDEVYRQMLDEPTPELGNRTPRDLTKTAKDRKRLAKWIVKLQDFLLSTPATAGMSDYDLGWMWKELGIENHRQESLFG